MDKTTMKRVVEAWKKEFEDTFKEMLSLAAIGRGIELQVRIRQQTKEGLQRSEEYQTMVKSAQKVKSIKPKEAIDFLFADPKQRAQVEAARGVADYLAHGLYHQCALAIGAYGKTHKLTTLPTSNPVKGWRAEINGHVEEDGKKIREILRELHSSPDNLIVEEYQWFKANKYVDAAKEIIDDAYKSLETTSKQSLAFDISQLAMLRGLAFGKRTFVEQPKAS